jgi:hypothetical protein
VTDNRTCVICQRALETPAMACTGCSNRLDATLVEIGHHHADLPEHLERGQGGGPKVSGSREAPLPLRVDPLDLSLPARAATIVEQVTNAYDVIQRTVQHTHFTGVGWVTDEVHVWQKRQLFDENGKPVKVPYGDQIGHQSVLSVLDLWVRDWVRHRQRGERLPVPAGASMISWLRVRLGDACKDYPAISDFNEEMQQLNAALRIACGRVERKPELLDVPCRRCDLLALHRLPGEDRVECGHCGDRATEDEYQRWVRLLAADYKP